MSDFWLKRIAWGMALLAVVILLISAVMLSLATGYTNSLSWLENQVRAIVSLGAPLLGLIIVLRLPRQRIGWLWLVFGLAAGLRTLAHAIYYYGGAQPGGYSALVYFLLWFSELGTLISFSCVILLLLWFPDGQLISPRWRLLYIWLFLAMIAASRVLFEAGPNWNGGESAGGIVINNPYGWLPPTTSIAVPLLAFISIILIMILAALSLFLRYRSSGEIVRLQVRWIVFGGFLYVIFNFFPVFFFGETEAYSGFEILIYVISFSAIIFIYLAVGIAILRYRLYDFEIIIRKTLVYTMLTGLLALVYFGAVILLQGIFESVSGQQSPIAIVLSTLIIAALFAPLRQRVQGVIDRRFFRKKYDAQQVLAQFAQTARDETDMVVLQAKLLQVVQEAIQPEGVQLWLSDNLRVDKPDPAFKKGY